DAISASDSAVDLRTYGRVAVVFPVTQWPNGGQASLGCSTLTSPSKGNVAASTTWLPVYDAYSPRSDTIAHEFGHTLGLNHSRSADYGTNPLGQPTDTPAIQDYGDIFSAMGSGGYSVIANGSLSLSYGQYTASHKRILQWLPPGGYQEVTSSGTFT